MSRIGMNRANPTTVANYLRKVRVGDLLAGNVVQHRRRINMDALGVSAYNLATLDTLVLDPSSRATSIYRATSRAGGVTGELAVVAYGATPTTGQIAVAPNGNIVTLATDAITDVDITYAPERGDVIESVFPVTAVVLTLPTSGHYARGVVLLLEAEALEGAVVGKKIVLVPGTAPATLQARLNVAKTQVLFNAATDAVTRARIKCLIGTEFDLAAILTDTDSMI